MDSTKAQIKRMVRKLGQQKKRQEGKIERGNNRVGKVRASKQACMRRKRK